ncbi:armadillo-type protein, partial [Xylaria grammica]
MRRHRVEDRPPRRPEGLCRIYPEGNDAESEFDIIAIHGLNTSSAETWTWRDRETGVEMNWLSHKDMLQNNFPSARIFTYDWPTDIFKSHRTIEQTTKELARRLLFAVRSRDAQTRSSKTRYILFIASCLGGLILVEALTTAAQSTDIELKRIWKTTGGIIFLGTPFRGTSYKDIAQGVHPLLERGTALTATVVTELLAQVQASTLPLQDLVSDFTAICIHRRPPCQVQTFYEKETSNLLRKVLPSWLADVLSKPKLLVDSNSARLDISTTPISFNRPHVMMNKFEGPHCEDYKAVVEQIDMMRQTFRLDVDDEILINAYNTEKLQVKRLSGAVLDIHHCHINLSIVKQSYKSAENASGGKNVRGASQLSLLDQLRVEEPDRSLQVPLSELFNNQKGEKRLCRRIFIQGRAGVGKTTLCKKIVHGFKNGTLWQGLYDRLLWVPLRNLKEKGRELPDYEQLFRLEYFSDHPNKKELAVELRSRVDGKGSKTLFLLDGLDEVSWGQGTDDPIFRFVTGLLNRDDVIITSRLSRNDFLGLHEVDLHLETIGFTPYQVREYLGMSFQDEKTISEVRLFLEEHPLLAHLLRIPIQLDALCCTWGAALRKRAARTMTAIYQAVEEELWRKDLRALKNIHVNTAKHMDRIIMETCYFEHELAFLEVIAFVGLHSGVANYRQDAIAKLEEAKALVSPTGNSLLGILGSMSFLRTPDSTSSPKSRIYHFIHLTYQEYFAARYFVRQWKADELLNCREFNQDTEDCSPRNFLQRHKYNVRYDMMWRFVAGLLASTVERSTDLESFFDRIDQQSPDLLGPAHQRLIIHCLHEVAEEDEPQGFAPLRKKMEDQLQDWLLSESGRDRNSMIADEVELPLRVLNNILGEVSQSDMRGLLTALRPRAILHPDTIKLISHWLRHSHCQNTKVAILDLIGRKHRAFGEQPDELITDLLQDDEHDIRLAAIKALAGRTNLSDSVIRLITELLNRSGGGQSCSFEILTVFMEAVHILGKQSILSAQITRSLTSLLKNNAHPRIREEVTEVLRRRQDLPDQMIRAIAALVGTGGRAAWGAVRICLGQPHLPDRIIQLIRDWLTKDSTWIRDFRRSKQIFRWPELRDIIVQVLTDFIEHPNDAMVKCDVIDSLAEWSLSPTHTLQLIARRVEDENHFVRRRAAWAIGGWMDLSKEAVELITRQVNHEKAVVRQATIQGLAARPSLPTELIQLVAGRLEDDDDIKYAVIETLRKQRDLPDPVIRSITELIQHDNSRVRRDIISFVASRPGLVQNDFELIMGALDDRDEKVRETAFYGLRNQTHRHLPDRAMREIVSQLDRVNTYMQKEAVEILQELPSLPDEIVESIANRLGDFKADIRKAAIRALSKRQNLPGPVVELIATRLCDDAGDVGFAALVALKGLPSLPNSIVDLIAQQLDHPKAAVRRKAIETLGCQSNVPDNVLELIAGRLDDPKISVRQEAVSILLPLCNRMPKHHIGNFYREIRDKSFWQHTSWIILGGRSYIRDGDREIVFDGDWEDWKSELDLRPKRQGAKGDMQQVKPSRGEVIRCQELRTDYFEGRMYDSDSES